jgi:hypothetical protein
MAKTIKASTHINQDFTMFKTGDLVIGSADPGKSVYSATGAKIDASGVTIYGEREAISSIQNELRASLTRNGGKPLTSSSSLNIKKKVKKPAALPDMQEDLQTPDLPSPPIKEQKTFTVQFENDFGKIKARVLHLIEHAQAFMLVFKNDDDMVFEPKIGESLFLYDEYKNKHEVYYPGVTFNWPDSTKQIMILFKVPTETTE